MGKDLQMKNESLKETLLVPGNVVVNRDGTAYIVVGDKIIREESYDNLGNFKEDLLHKSYDNLDIMKVYEVVYNFGKLFKLNPFNSGDMNLVWTRKEYPQIKIGSYQVVFEYDRIQVGCQTINKETIKQICDVFYPEA